MSFFGMDTSLDRDKHQFSQDEDLAVYTFGEEGYDGLADALDEGLDELNDETFGDDAGPASDFDFSAQTLPGDDLPPKQSFLGNSQSQQSLRDVGLGHGAETSPSLQSIWGSGSHQDITSQADRFSMQDNYRDPASTPPGLHGGLGSQRFSPFGDLNLQASPSQHPPRARTLADIEAEQRVSAQLSRLSLSGGSTSSPQLAHQQPNREYAHQSPHLQQSQSLNADLERELYMRRQQDLAALQQQQQLELMRQHQQQQQMQFLQQQEQEYQAQQQQRQFQQQQQRLLQQQLHSAQSGLPRTPGSQHQQPQPLPRHPLLDQLSALESSGVIIPPEQREALMNEAMTKILEAERMEEVRRRRLIKIASMSKYNDIMTQSDKDFITRIQVSQLVTQDPYAEDFYAQIYVSIHGRGHHRNQSVVSFGKGGGVGATAGPGTHRGGRRENALQRMHSQVERIVNNSKNREPASSMHLQGALGKVSGRSYKAAPRQLLQVGTASSIEAREGAAKEAARAGRDALAGAAGGELVRLQPLTRRQVLVAIEGLYDTLLGVEQLRREQPPRDEEEAFARWQERYNALSEKLWIDSKIMAPLETSDPHPFISIIAPNKGKLLLPRLLRHIEPKRLDLFVTLLIACYSQLDVVREAHALDQLEDSLEKRAAQKSHGLFFKCVFPVVQSRVDDAPLRFVTGMLGLLLESTSVVRLAQTEPGLALLTMFLSRVAALKETPLTAPEAPTPEELDHWQIMFDHLCQFLFGSLDSLFPSTRIAASLPLPPNAYMQQHSAALDLADKPVWNFLGAIGLLAASAQQQQLVSEVRDKVLQNVLAARKGWVADEGERQLKLDNVDRFLHALGLDSSQIAV